MVAGCCTDVLRKARPWQQEIEAVCPLSVDRFKHPTSIGFIAPHAAVDVCGDGRSIKYGLPARWDPRTSRDLEQEPGFPPPYRWTAPPSPPTISSSSSFTNELSSTLSLPSTISSSMGVSGSSWAAGRQGVIKHVPVTPVGGQTGGNAADWTIGAVFANTVQQGGGTSTAVFGRHQLSLQQQQLQHGRHQQHEDLPERPSGSTLAAAVGFSALSPRLAQAMEGVAAARGRLESAAAALTVTRVADCWGETVEHALSHALDARVALDRAKTLASWMADARLEEEKIMREWVQGDTSAAVAARAASEEEALVAARGAVSKLVKGRIEAMAGALADAARMEEVALAARAVLAMETGCVAAALRATEEDRYLAALAAARSASATQTDVVNRLRADAEAELLQQLTARSITDIARQSEAEARLGAEEAAFFSACTVAKMFEEAHAQAVRDADEAADSREREAVEARRRTHVEMYRQAEMGNQLAAAALRNAVAEAQEQRLARVRRAAAAERAAEHEAFRVERGRDEVRVAGREQADAYDRDAVRMLDGANLAAREQAAARQAVLARLRMAAEARVEAALQASRHFVVAQATLATELAEGVEAHVRAADAQCAQARMCERQEAATRSDAADVAHLHAVGNARGVSEARAGLLQALRRSAEAGVRDALTASARVLADKRGQLQGLVGATEAALEAAEERARDAARTLRLAEAGAVSDLERQVVEAREASGWAWSCACQKEAELRRALGAEYTEAMAAAHGTAAARKAAEMSARETAEARLREEEAVRRRVQEETAAAMSAAAEVAMAAAATAALNAAAARKSRDRSCSS